MSFSIISKQNISIYAYVNLKRSHFWGFNLGDTAIFPKLGQKYHFFIVNVSDLRNSPLSNVTNSTMVQNLWRYSDYLKMKVVFFHSKTLKPFFSKLYYSKVQLQNAIFLSFALRRLREVSIDPKFYLVLGSGHNSIPRKWDILKFTYTHISKLIYSNYSKTKKVCL